VSQHLKAEPVVAQPNVAAANVIHFRLHDIWSVEQDLAFPHLNDQISLPADAGASAIDLETDL